MRNVKIKEEGVGKEELLLIGLCVCVAGGLDSISFHMA